MPRLITVVVVLIVLSFGMYLYIRTVYLNTRLRHEHFKVKV